MGFTVMNMAASALAVCKVVTPVSEEAPSGQNYRLEAYATLLSGASSENLRPSRTCLLGPVVATRWPKVP
jgi:hypothetical protein